jgi:protein-tyrosine phosphatase
MSGCIPICARKSLAQSLFTLLCEVCLMPEIAERLNFRDVGGLPTVGGGKVCPGIFYRAEGPKNFVGRHLQNLKALGIRTIFDLRSDGERDDDPHDWHGDTCQWLHLDVNTDLRTADTTEWERLRDDPDPALSRLIMSQNYAAMPAALLPHWSVIAKAFLEHSVPAMINCTAGKDRTGVAVALLLTMVGVTRDAIIADYLKSDIFGQNMAMQGSIRQGFMDSFGFIPNQVAIDALIGVDAEYLEAALDQVEKRWGGIEGYCKAAGLDAAMLDRLRALLITC